MTRFTAKRSAAVMAVSAAVTLATVAAATSASAATPGVTAPGLLNVTRKGEGANALHVTWKSVPRAARYTVNTFDGKNHRAYTMPAGTTSFDFDGGDICTRSRVIVSAISADGSQSSTAPYLVAPLGAGGARNVAIDRPDPGTSGTVKWEGPSGAGETAATNYRVVVKSMEKGEVLATRVSSEPFQKLDKLDPSKAYNVSVTPQNKWGGCATTNALMRGVQPGPVGKLDVARDPASPSRVVVTWGDPSWNGYGALQGYEIGYRSPSMRTPEWKAVDPSIHKAELNLDPNRRWSIWVRAINGKVAGSPGREFIQEALGTPGAKVSDPRVKILEGDSGKINVTFDGPVGSSAAYPKMDVAIAPTLGGDGLHEHQQVFNRAGAYSFSSVPCGLYTVTVTGWGGASEKEFARNVINRCNQGEVSKNLWRVAYGSAEIADHSINMTKGGEARVVSTVPRASQDMVFTTTAKLESGRGYGIWTRANLTTGAAVSGYSFQFDPGYQYVDAKFGKALLLRVWDNGRECGTPIAKVQWPAGLNVNGENRVMVVAKGDSLYATIDGIRMFDVPSLSDALAKSGCQMKTPSGTQVGFRTWNSDGRATFRNTTIS